MVETGVPTDMQNTRSCNQMFHTLVRIMYIAAVDKFTIKAFLVQHQYFYAVNRNM
jgi:hypothetical protein